MKDFKEKDGWIEIDELHAEDKFDAENNFFTSWDEPPTLPNLYYEMDLKNTFRIDKETYQFDND